MNLPGQRSSQPDSPWRHLRAAHILTALLAVPLFVPPSGWAARHDHTFAVSREALKKMAGAALITITATAGEASALHVPP